MTRFCFIALTISYAISFYSVVRTHLWIRRARKQEELWFQKLREFQNNYQ